MDAEIKALETIVKETEKIRDKYQKKAEKEREKVNEAYITVCGEKCYTEQDIMDMYEADYFSCDQCDKYIEKLNKRKEIAGQEGYLTPSERVCKILNNTINNYTEEIRDGKNNQKY